MIHYDAGAPINYFVLLDEDRVVLRFSVRVKFEACQPRRALEMVDGTHPGNFQVAQHGLIWEDRCEIVRQER